jgi:hypothetical protein
LANEMSSCMVRAATSLVSAPPKRCAMPCISLMKRGGRNSGDTRKAKKTALYQEV